MNLSTSWSSSARTSRPTRAWPNAPATAANPAVATNLRRPLVASFMESPPERSIDLARKPRLRQREPAEHAGKLTPSLLRALVDGDLRAEDRCAAVDAGLDLDGPETRKGELAAVAPVLARTEAPDRARCRLDASGFVTHLHKDFLGIERQPFADLEADHDGVGAGVRR